MFGHGLNLQSCHRMVFCGMSDSAEQFYQAVRRCWRFGQTHPVEVHVVISEPELAVLDNVNAKQERMREMGDAVVKLTRAKVIESLGLAAFSMTSDIYEPKKAITIPPWLTAAT
jgi:SNF2 family DNA or RNA helicase